MANPLILIALLVGAAALALKKPKATTAAPGSLPATDTNALPPAPAGGSQTVPIAANLPGVAQPNQPTGTITLPISGTGWTLADDGSNDLAISDPNGVKYAIHRSQVIKGLLNSVVVTIRPDLIVLNPKILYVTTEATPPGATLPSNTAPPATAPPATAPPTTQQVLTDAANQVAQALPQLAPVLTPPVAVQAQETSAAVDPHGTVALAGKLINAESANGWKTALASDVMAWQKKMSLVDDGKFGPKSALLMGNEVGVLPLLRYYSSTGGTLAAQLTAYRTSLGALASQVSATNLAHSLALRSSAMYETGLGYASSPAAVPATARVAQATALTAAIKGA